MRSDAKSFFEGIVEVLWGGVAQFGGYFGGGLLCVTQVAMCEVEALLGQVAEYSGIECFLEAAFELVFIQTNDAGYLGEVRRAIDALIDQVANGNELLFI